LIEAVRGDITREAVDAIVNAARFVLFEDETHAVFAPALASAA
jgi:hypothetical protein